MRVMSHVESVALPEGSIERPVVLRYQIVKTESSLFEKLIHLSES
jgi:hypothetical protein